MTVLLEMMATSKSLSIINWCTSVFLLHAQLINTILQTNLWLSIWMRFKSINKILNEFTRLSLATIDRVANLHDRLNDVVASINDCYGLQVESRTNWKFKYLFSNWFWYFLAQVLLKFSTEFIYALVSAFSLYRQVWQSNVQSPPLIAIYILWTIDHLIYISAMIFVANQVTNEV